MSLLSIAERLISIDKNPVRFNQARCLHSLNKFVECEACYELCPVDAISPGKPPGFNENICQSCLACIPVCPTGAFFAEDTVPALLKCAVRTGARHLALACAVHPRIESGLKEAEIVIRIRGCLAGIGTGGYLSLFALGKQKVFVRLDACEACPWGKLQAEIIQQVNETKSLLSAWGMADQLELVLQVKDEPLDDRPIWDAENPPLSRRDLFRFSAHRRQPMVANIGNTSQHENQPALNRLRLIAALAKMPEMTEELPELPGFANLTISTDCTACKTCVRACPTGALSFNLHDESETFSLTFQPDHCIGCGICQQMCIPNAISIDHQPALKEIFGQEESELLLAGKVTRCGRCNAVMAKKPDTELCAICQYRQKNPLGR